MRILIIEDEKITAKDLSKTILSVEPDAEIVEILHSVEDALVFFKQNQNIDLIFSDIQLGDGLSFAIFTQIDNKIPVVFCTAYNDYTLQAFDVMGIDYIIKPFSKDTVTKAINKFRLLRQSEPVPDFNRLLHNLTTHFQPSIMPSIIIHQGEKIIPVSGNDIAFFYIQKKDVFAYTFQKKEWKVSDNLEALEQKFSPFFYRSNRQFLVNRKAIISASQYFHRKMVLTMNVEFTEKILVGKEKVTDFLEWLSRQ